MLWLKALHIIAVITWFAALFYLPRLFVYHAATESREVAEQLKIMERKLYRGIMVPSAIAVLLLGLALLHGYAWQAYSSSGWLHAKLALVVVLYGYHGLCWHHLRQFQQDRNHRSHRYFRWFNELPALMLVSIVLLAVAKPF
ncbi:MAG: protoporphyrinogen oxidase HemJ [Gammaproteobacteria bacterium]|nr:protoporphyrinogen oxidase HemJ [Gammaproteobacteria bacterium]